MDDGDGKFEETNSRLAQGLKSCRTVVDSYRVLLSVPAQPGGAELASVAHDEAGAVSRDKVQG